MASEARIRQATPQDAEAVTDILREAARWLEQAGMPMWQQQELEPSRIVADVRAGLFFLAEHSGDPAGTMKFQLDDHAFWPDAGREDAAYVHRLAVRRRYAGTGLSRTGSRADPWAWPPVPAARLRGGSAAAAGDL